MEVITPTEVQLKELNRFHDEWEHWEFDLQTFLTDRIREGRWPTGAVLLVNEKYYFSVDRDRPNPDYDWDEGHQQATPLCDYEELITLLKPTCIPADWRINAIPVTVEIPSGMTEVVNESFPTFLMGLHGHSDEGEEGEEGQCGNS